MNIRPTQTGDLPALSDFLTRGGAPCTAETLRWKFWNSPGQVNGGGKSILAEIDSQIVGHIGVVPTVVQADSRRHSGLAGGWFVDWMVREDLRSRGIGVFLLREAQRVCPVLMTIQGSPETQTALPALKWSAHPVLAIYKLNARPEAAEQGGTSPQKLIAELARRAWYHPVTRAIPAGWALDEAERTVTVPVLPALPAATSALSVLWDELHGPARAGKRARKAVPSASATDSPAGAPGEIARVDGAGSATAQLAARADGPLGVSLVGGQHATFAVPTAWSYLDAVVARQGHGADRLFGRFERSGTFLRWSFRDHPSGRYHLAVAHDTAGPGGYVIWRTCGGPHGRLDGRVIDILAPWDRADVWRWLISVAVSRLVGEDVTQITCLAGRHTLLANALRSNRFLARQTVPLWRSPQADDLPAPGSWHATFADSDIDTACPL